MRVLFPVDGSESALSAVEKASGFLDPAQTEVYLLTVVTPMVFEASMLSAEPDNEVGQGILDRAEQFAKNAGFNAVERSRITSSDPVEAICRFATEHQVDQIIIGSHGVQGFARFLQGSVSEQVLEEAEQPVVLIRNDPNNTVEISHFEQVALPTRP